MKKEYQVAAKVCFIRVIFAEDKKEAQAKMMEWLGENEILSKDIDELITFEIEER